MVNHSQKQLVLPRWISDSTLLGSNWLIFGVTPLVLLFMPAEEPVVGMLTTAVLSQPGWAVWLTALADNSACVIWEMLNCRFFCGLVIADVMGIDVESASVGWLVALVLLTLETPSIERCSCCINWPILADPVLLSVTKFCCSSWWQNRKRCRINHYFITNYKHAGKRENNHWLIWSLMH